jgi:hypothetical protein
MQALRDKQGRLLPTGECWCGCEDETTPGNFFKPGHDKFAESAIIVIKYGSVMEFVLESGYGPGGKNLRVELGKRKKGA